MRGKFIVLEGLDGSGKTTQAPRLQTLLQSHGIETSMAKDPETSPLGKFVRPLIKNTDIYPESMTSLEQFFIFGAAKVDMKYQVINPTLNAGKWLISDRFNLGIFAYQGYTDESPADWLYWQRMEDLMFPILRDVWPDLTLVLDIPVEVSEARRIADQGDGRRFEDKDRTYRERVRKGYLYYKDMPGVVILNGNQPEDAVFADIQRVVEQHFAL